PNVIDDGFIELVTANPHGALVHHAPKRDDGHFRCATANITHHGTAGIRYRQARADGGGHGFFDQIELAVSCHERRFANSPALDLGGAAGNTDNDARTGRKHAARMHHANELLEHLLGDREVRNDAVFHGARCLDVARYPPQHLLGLVTDRLDDLLATGAAIVPDGNHGRVVYHNAFAAYINERIGRAQINGHVAGKVTTKETEHGRPVLSVIKPLMITYNYPFKGPGGLFRQVLSHRPSFVPRPATTTRNEYIHGNFRPSYRSPCPTGMPGTPTRRGHPPAN